MQQSIVMLVTFVVGLLFIIMWNRQRVKGKVLGMIVRKDRSVLPKLLQLSDDFIIWGTRCYELYPDFVRICRFPMGWPAFMQELVPAVLLDEEDRVPLDWIHIDNRQGSAMELRAALDENWLRKLVEESAKEPGGSGKFNFKKALPIILIAVGAIGLIALFYFKNKSKAAPPTAVEIQFILDWIGGVL